MTVTVRSATVEDLRAVASLHQDELPGGLFPRLGPDFLWRWHRAHLESGHGLVVVAIVRRGQGVPALAGFLTADLDHATFVNEVLATRRAEMTLAGAVALARRPQVARYFVRTRARRYVQRLVGRTRTRRDVRHASLRTHSSVARARAELAAIAVRRDVRARGIGGLLLAEFRSRCAAAGVETAELVTGARAEGAIRLYTRHGWSDRGEEIARDGGRVRRFRLDLTSPAEAAS